MSRYYHLIVILTVYCIKNNCDQTEPSSHQLLCIDTECEESIGEVETLQHYSPDVLYKLKFNEREKMNIYGITKDEQYYLAEHDNQRGLIETKFVQVLKQNYKTGNLKATSLDRNWLPIRDFSGINDINLDNQAAPTSGIVGVAGDVSSGHNKDEIKSTEEEEKIHGTVETLPVNKENHVSSSLDEMSNDSHHLQSETSPGNLNANSQPTKSLTLNQANPVQDPAAKPTSGMILEILSKTIHSFEPAVNSFTQATPLQSNDTKASSNQTYAFYVTSNQTEAQQIANGALEKRATAVPITSLPSDGSNGAQESLNSLPTQPVTHSFIPESSSTNTSKGPGFEDSTNSSHANPNSPNGSNFDSIKASDQKRDSGAQKGVDDSADTIEHPHQPGPLIGPLPHQPQENSPDTTPFDEDAAFAPPNIETAPPEIQPNVESMKIPETVPTEKAKEFVDQANQTNGAFTGNHQDSHTNITFRGESSLGLEHSPTLKQKEGQNIRIISQTQPGKVPFISTNSYSQDKTPNKVPMDPEKVIKDSLYQDPGRVDSTSTNPSDSFASTTNNLFEVLDCSKDGKWNGSIQRCAKITCRLVKPHSGVLLLTKKKARYYPGEFILLSCHDGNKKTLKCGLDGKWQGNLDCPEPEKKTCPPIPPLKDGTHNGSMDATSYPDGVLITFACNPDHFRIGVPYTRCRQGSWTSKVPRCGPLEIVSLQRSPSSSSNSFTVLGTILFIILFAILLLISIILHRIRQRHLEKQYWKRYFGNYTYRQSSTNITAACNQEMRFFRQYRSPVPVTDL